MGIIPPNPSKIAMPKTQPQTECLGCASTQYKYNNGVFVCIYCDRVSNEPVKPAGPPSVGVWY